MKHGFDLTDFLLSVWISDREHDGSGAVVTDRAQLIVFKIILADSCSHCSLSPSRVILAFGQQGKP